MNCFSIGFQVHQAHLRSLLRGEPVSQILSLDDYVEPSRSLLVHPQSLTELLIQVCSLIALQLLNVHVRGRGMCGVIKNSFCSQI